MSPAICEQQPTVTSAAPAPRRRRGFAAAAALAGATLATALALCPLGAAADDTVTLSLTLQNHQFQPAEVHAPPGKPIAFRVKNLNDIVSEFESSDLHFEKIAPAGADIVVYVRPLQPGRYNFYDDFHRDTQGWLVVP